jgi:hypothetical protein
MMSLRNRLCILTLAVLLALYWAYPQYQARWGIKPPPPPAPAAAPPTDVSAVKPKRKARRKPRAAPKDPAVEEIVLRKKIRGERLREKGEALGGGTPEKE